MIRFRIVTATIDEIVPVVAYLSQHLFPFHLTVPGKSHNSIFDFKDFIRRHPRISKMIPEFQVDLMHENEMLEPSNPDTSSKFKTVNFIVDLPHTPGRPAFGSLGAGHEAALHGSCMSFPNFRLLTRPQTSGIKG